MQFSGVDAVEKLAVSLLAPLNWTATSRAVGGQLEGRAFARFDHALHVGDDTAAPGDFDGAAVGQAELLEETDVVQAGP